MNACKVSGLLPACHAIFVDWAFREQRRVDNSLRAESLSISLDKSGRGKNTLPAGSTFPVKHALN